ncbi:MAG: putative membrane protein [Glaciecola sp.]|jgi:uncharacterized membrane protein
MIKAPSQDYQIDIKALLERGNVATKKNLPVILRSLFFVIFIVLLSFVAFFNVYNIETIAQLEALQTETYFLNMFLTVLLAPLWAGIAMMAVNTERKKDISFSQLFNFTYLILGLATAELCISLLTQVGMSLFIVPAIYIYITTSFTKFLIADKRMSPFVAIKVSIQMANQHLFKLSMLFLIFFALALLGMITFGLAFIWITPLYYNVTAILYNDLFNSQVEDQNVEHLTNTEESHFDA